MARPRLHYVDLARGFAIGLALFSHVLVGTGGWNSIPDGSSWLHGLRGLTRTATPTFIVLFGMSVELAYVRRWGVDRRTTVRILLRRSFQCYVAVVALAVAAVLGTLITFPEALRGMVFLELVPNGNIFVFYVGALLLTLALIPLRRWAGLMPTLLLTLASWPIVHVLQARGVPPLLDPLTSRAFGIGTLLGPSVMQAMPIIVIGMIIANLASHPQDRNSRVQAAAVVAGLVGVVAFLLVWRGPFELIRSFIAEWRDVNYWAYYAVGTFLALVVIAISWGACSVYSDLGARGRSFFGRNSLQAFAIGNVIINISVAHVQFNNFLFSAISAIVFVSAFWFVFGVWIRIYRAERSAGFRKLVGGTSLTAASSGRTRPLP